MLSTQFVKRASAKNIFKLFSCALANSKAVRQAAIAYVKTEYRVNAPT